MGCVSSKKARYESPLSNIAISSSSSKNAGPKRQVASSVPLHVDAVFGTLEEIKEEPDEEVEVDEEEEHEQDEGKEESVERRPGFQDHSSDLRALKKGPTDKKVAFSIKFGRLIEGEHVAAGWPVWLSAVAGEAIEGWLPLRSDTFQRLEKIGEGTYSDVYRARDTETGKMVALKKIRFDNFQAESVRFMAREILILRKLDHPNIMKLEGIITSRLSCSLYLVFEYMEHDLAGLLSCPDIKFTDSQIKCYMRQLLSGLEYCHRRGIMHRDIKTSNVLINNEGILKIGDFGLANFLRPKEKQPLTSRVVTLWYRPPELLLGSTNYGEAVDLWSVGCVFAEFFLGRPLFEGRTEYFHTKPYACETSSLPMYPPNKEIDAKFREDARRKKSGATGRAQSGSRHTRLVRKVSQESNDFCNVVPREEIEGNVQIAHRKRGVSANVYKRRGGPESRTTSNQPLDTMSEASQLTEESNVSTIRSLPAYNTQSTTGISLPKRKKQPDVFTRLHDNHTSRRRRATTLESSDILHVHDVLDSDVYTNDVIEHREKMHLPHELAEDYVNKKKRGRVRLETSRQNGQPQQALHRSRFN